jgi:adenylate cyclase
MKSGPFLVICGVPSLDRAYRIHQGRQSIGRAHDCEICIGHRSVSRRHAEITLDGETLQIADLRSVNGTYLNGNPIVRAAIKVGDTIRIGDVTLELVDALETIRARVDEEEETEHVPVDSPDSIETIIELMSPSDSKVLKLMLEGLPEKTIATRLHLSEQTVHWRVKRIYKTVGVHSRSELLTLLLKRQS